MRQYSQTSAVAAGYSERPVLPSIQQLFHGEGPREPTSLTLAPLQISPDDHSSCSCYQSYDVQRTSPRSCPDSSAKAHSQWHQGGSTMHPFPLPSKQPIHPLSLHATQMTCPKSTSLSPLSPHNYSPSHSNYNQYVKPDSCHAQLPSTYAVSPSIYIRPSPPCSGWTPVVPSNAQPRQSPSAPISDMTEDGPEDIFSASMKYECNICKKRFYRPSGLRIHLASHSSDKPFVCPVPGCARSFGVLSNMRRHARLHQETGDHMSPIDS